VSSLDLLHLARTAAERAAAYLRGVERPADPSRWTLKGSRDFVTDVDRTAERIITEVLLAAEPGSRIVGEELHPEVVTEGMVWIVDPLDGTTNFLHDFPRYAVSIAGAVDGVLAAAAIVNVPGGETYTASRGGGAWHGERRLAVSAIRDPAFALIGTGFPFTDASQIAEYLDQFRRIAGHTSGIRRPGAASLDLADVAAGRFDGFWEQQLSAWDIAAGTLLIREAGGLVTDLSGRDIGIEHTPVVAGNPTIHAWLLDMLRSDGALSLRGKPAWRFGMSDADSLTRASSLDEWARAIARPTISPAGGSAAALAAAAAAAVVEMVAGLTAAREAYALVHEEARAARARAEGLRQELLTLASADAEALQRFEQALALPKGSAAERELRERRKRSALREGADIQRDVLARCGEVAELGVAMVERGLKSARGDAGTAVFLAAGAARSASWAIRMNLQDEPPGSEFGGIVAPAAVRLAGVEEAERLVGRLLDRPPE